MILELTYSSILFPCATKRETCWGLILSKL